MAGGAILPLNGTDLFYTTQGPETGIPLLLIHGWTCDQTDWAFQTALLALSRVFFVIAMDLRGHGRSFCPSSAAAFDPVTMAEDGAALLRHLGVGLSNEAIVIGHSLGGLVVTELVAAYPELVQGHVLLDPAYILTPDIIGALIPALEQNFDSATVKFFNSAYTKGTPDYIPEWHKLRAWGADKQIMVAAFKQMGTCLGPSGAEYLKSKKVEGTPRLAVHSTEAGIEIEKGAGIDPKFDKIQLIQVGHWIMQTAPKEFNTLVEDWMKQWGWLKGNNTLLTG
jgi:pimeloyl-ACP methyl ester carboxylesterase